LYKEQLDVRVCYCDLQWNDTRNCWSDMQFTYWLHSFNFLLKYPAPTCEHCKCV